MTRFSMVRRFLRHAEGSVFLMVGISILVVAAAGGAGIDLGTQQLMRAKLQQATDAAALAGASMPATIDNAPTTAAQRQAAATRIYELDFPDTYLGMPRPTPVVNATDTSVTVSVPSFTTPTHFISLVGVDTLTTAASTTVAITNSTTPQAYDMVLLLDNSESMSSNDVGTGGLDGNEATAHPAGISTCINYYKSANVPAVLVTALPGTTLDYWNSYIQSQCQGYGTQGNNSGALSYGYIGDDRLNSLRSSATTIAHKLLVESSVGSQMALVSWDDRILNTTPSTGLTTNYTDISNALLGMYSFGSTNSKLPLQQAEQIMRSANPNHVRAVVLLTDGENTSDAPLTAIGLDKNDNVVYQDSSGCDGNDFCAPANVHSLAECDTLKASGVLIYTIGYGKDVQTTESAAQAFLSQCASPNPAGGSNEGLYFFLAPDAATLQTTFSTILTNLKQIRISQ